jgi:hypothetical protein
MEAGLDGGVEAGAFCAGACPSSMAANSGIARVVSGLCIECIVPSGRDNGKQHGQCGPNITNQNLQNLGFGALRGFGLFYFSQNLLISELLARDSGIRS